MRYDKGTFVVVPNLNILSGQAPELQVLFFWICAHADENGQCFPTRKKLGKLGGIKSERTIDKYIEALVDIGIITKENRRKAGTKENTSNMYQINIVGHEIAPPPAPNDTTPGAPNGGETISNINYTHLTIVSEPTEDTKEVVQTAILPSNFGKTYINRLFAVYRRLFKDKFGFEPTINMGLFGKTMKALVETKNELQIASLLVVFFNWRGMSSTDDFAHKKLVDATFNISWFNGSINAYEAYLRNVLSINPDSEQELRQFIKDNLSRLST